MPSTNAINREFGVEPAQLDLQSSPIPGGRLARLYAYMVLDHPRLTLLLVGLLVLAGVWFAQGFRLDASSDSLLLENDEDLRFYHGIRARYGSDDSLIVTYTPDGPLMTPETLQRLRYLRDELSGLERIAGVTSLLDVPLLDSPRVSLGEVREGVRTLETPGVDLELAAREFRTNPLYANRLMSLDGATTALEVRLQPDVLLEELMRQRDELQEIRLGRALTRTEHAVLTALNERIGSRRQLLAEQQQADVAAVREVLDRYRDGAQIHLGGVPMITADMVEFIRADLKTFGLGVALFMVLLLGVAFKRWRWVQVPMLICFATVAVMTGLLGLTGWQVTVVSSNFVSLLLIIALSLTVHLIVRHEELHSEHPEASQRTLVRDTLRSLATPSLFTALTTAVAFGSLVVSDIRPVIDFGWMMVVGVLLAFVLAFVIFPAALVPLRPGTPVLRRHDATAVITRGFARLVERHGNITLAAYLLILVASIAGIARLTVENSFIEYFKTSTEIHQGMALVDRQLGGTIPLEVVVGPDQVFLDDQAALAREGAGGGAAGITGDSYWFNTFELERVAEIHAYLAGYDSIGKVLSMATTMEVLEMLNDDRPLDNLTLSVMHQRLPDAVRTTLFDPYMSKDGNQLRFAMRVIDSSPDLRRDRLIRQLEQGLVNDLGLEPEQARVNGMLVLYNNVLQSLFRSQILTLGAVFLAIFGMFLLLFRSLRLAAIGVMPTLTAAALVLGIMGWLGIPLDIMTITIAAITIGIGVHDTIHYLHRFRHEFPVDHDYRAAVKRCHASVGRAIYYTSLTVTLGFSILALSNFIPTIYFGLLTGLAMVAALIANLTLLPLLVIKLRPLGSGA